MKAISFRDLPFKIYFVLENPEEEPQRKATVEGEDPTSLTNILTPCLGFGASGEDCDSEGPSFAAALYIQVCSAFDSILFFFLRGHQNTQPTLPPLNATPPK